MEKLSPVRKIRMSVDMSWHGKGPEDAYESATNLSLEQLFKRYGERTFSRLTNKSNSLFLQIENSDLRLKRK